mgnify:CR=1 FL=1
MMQTKKRFVGTIYTDDKHPATAARVYLQQTLKHDAILPGDFLVISEPSDDTKYFAKVDDIHETPLYVRNPDSIVFLSRHLDNQDKDLTELSNLPDAKKETKIIIRAQLHRVETRSTITGPGLRPSAVSVFRLADADEIGALLNFPEVGFPLFLVRSNGELYIDSRNKPVIPRIDSKAPLTGMLSVGSPGSGKTMFNGAFAWWYSHHGWSAIVINNKADDLLYLDRPAPYNDTNWKHLEWQPQGVPSFQVIYPQVNGCSRMNGNTIPFTFDTDQLQPEALTALIDFSERGIIHLPNLFRQWRDTRSGTLLDFIEYLESGTRQGFYVHYPLRVNGRPVDLRVHAATIDSAVSVLQSYSHYFDGQGTMPTAADIVESGLVTSFDLSRADPIISKLMIQHYLHAIRTHQRMMLTSDENADLVPLLFEVDEAHQFFKRYGNDELSRTIELELETHIKLSRSMKVATVLSSQLGSELHPAANRLATVKMVMRSDRTELKSLGLALSDSELGAIENFSPGTAQLRDGFRMKVPMYVKVPMCPAEVRGQT